MHVIGFDTTENNVGTYSREEKNFVKTPEEPKMSIVWVRFDGIDKDLRYLNLDYNLNVGDYVFVTGKLAGKRGIVARVETCFKVDPEDYEYISAKSVAPELKGHWEHKLNLMISTGEEAPTPDEFRSFAKPAEEKEYVIGEGLSFEVGATFDADEKIVHRGIRYCDEGKVLYLDIRNGTGTAFIQGETCYEVNFKVHDGMISEMYCDCPYGGPCKHLVAVTVTLNILLDDFGYDPEEGYTAMSAALFYSLLEKRDSIDL